MVVIYACLVVTYCVPMVAEDAGAHWVSTWASAPMGLAPTDKDVSSNATYRSFLHITVPGTVVRLVLTNEFGTSPLTLRDVHVALSSDYSSVEQGTDRRVTFAGNGDVTIPAGASVISDNVPIVLAPLARLSISIFVPQQRLEVRTCHEQSQTRNLIELGDLASESMLGATPFGPWCFLKRIEVQCEKNAATIVALGDSITDGWRSSVDEDQRWTDVLAKRLMRTRAGGRLSIANEGLGGNRLLNDGIGQVSALARFDRDVLSQPGVKYLIILEGINDITQNDPALSKVGSERITAENLINALLQLIMRAHEHNIRVIGGTLIPHGGTYYSPGEAGEKIRKTVNAWIRTSGAFDGVIDFDRALREPENDTVLERKYDSGDHVHPNDLGYATMGESIDIKLFK